jgi:hypothetical protein
MGVNCWWTRSNFIDPPSPIRHQLRPHRVRQVISVFRTALLLLLTAGAVAAMTLWVRSFRKSDCVVWIHDTVHVRWVHTLRQDSGTRVICQLWSHGRSITWYWLRIEEDPVRTIQELSPEQNWELSRDGLKPGIYWWTDLYSTNGLEKATQRLGHLPLGCAAELWADRWHVEHCFAIRVHFWLLGLGLGLFPGLYVNRAIRRLHRWRRLSRGLCPACGYDLRASTGRCPECGEAIPAHK